MHRNIKIAIGVAALAGAMGLGMAIRTASADQPHMQNALADLRAARSELNAALADKGGHRVKAIADTDAAIAEVQAGMTFDRTH
jgi:hypothetical protein